MSWQLHDAATPTRTLLLVSRFGHCLNDLLFRAQHRCAATIEIPAVVSNHRDFEGLAAAHGVPFHYLPVTRRTTKVEAEARLLELVDELDIDLVVLARYMQVLSNDLCTKLEGRAINIHHSFLPSFKGARPYHQAHARGRQADRRHGPLRDRRTSTRDRSSSRTSPASTTPLTPDELVAAGRDVEAQVLARAVRLAHRAPGAARRQPDRRLPLRRGPTAGPLRAVARRGPVTFGRGHVLTTVRKWMRTLCVRSRSHHGGVMKGLLPFAALCLLPPLFLYGLHKLVVVLPARWSRRHGPPEPTGPSLQRLVLDLQRLEREFRRVQASDEPGKTRRLAAVSLAYDETLRACCHSLGLDEPAPSPLSAIDRLQTEADLCQHGLIW